jgi:hypothetical protein
MEDNNSSGKEKTLESWRAELESLAKTCNGEKWLQLLYSSYLNRFLSDNGRIWTTGQLMVPLSLAPIAVVPTLKEALTVFNLFVLAVPSISLIWLWLVIAENHRAFQNKSEQWLSEIEKVMKVNKPGGPKGDGILVRPGMIQKVRWCLAWGLTVFWPLLIALVAVAKACLKP